MSIFNLEEIINIQSLHEKLKTYCVGFDLNEY